APTLSALSQARTATACGPAADGIVDDLVESFTIKLPQLAAGPHAVAVRAWDSADNVGAGGLTIRAPGK
ncbi:MAG TPA: hypothetical protein VN903_40280, partial [Polyangia bacterium]|nr:hypothetical protein [Polyangia bacterium]